MANHVSALKRVRQTLKKTEVNRNNRSRVRGSLRKMREMVAAGNKVAAEKQFRETVSALDKAIQKGVLHKNTAGRYKSRLAAHVKAIK
jgi:small subunit ribosomal protein S20